MTLPSVREVRILDAQQIDVFDIDSVRTRPGADAVFVKIAVADRDRRSRRAAEKTGLIVDKLDCVHCQTAFDQANTCAVHVGHTGACQGQVPHRRVITPNDKKPHSVARLVGDDDAGVGALNHEVVGVPHCAVEILSGLDLDIIAVLGDRGRC